MTRRLLRGAVIVAVLWGTLAGPAAPIARADHQGNHAEPPGPAVARFPEGFPALVDDEWGFPLGGFGGALGDDADWGVTPDPAAPDRPNVIMVHGNVVDAADWYPVRDAFIAAGWSPDDLWALSYNGIGSQSGSDGTGNPRRDAEHDADPNFDGISRTTGNDRNVADLRAFIEAVRAFTGEDEYVLVGHSLGVTVGRKTLFVHPELRDGLLAFVSLAGANHGTSLCPPGSEGVVMSCDQIAEGTDWLAELNGPDGSLETYGPTRWLSVYDGTGVMDVAFLGTYAQSPILRGAENVELADNHNDLRIAPASIERYRLWIEGVVDVASPSTAGPSPSDANDAAVAADTAPGGDDDVLPATGGTNGAVGGALATAAAALWIRRRRRHRLTA